MPGGNVGRALNTFLHTVPNVCECEHFFSQHGSNKKGEGDGFLWYTWLLKILKSDILK